MFFDTGGQEDDYKESVSASAAAHSIWDNSVEFLAEVLRTADSDAKTGGPKARSFETIPNAPIDCWPRPTNCFS